jgi:hypothetical protein
MLYPILDEPELGGGSDSTIENVRCCFVLTCFDYVFPLILEDEPWLPSFLLLVCEAGLLFKA